MSDDKAYFFDNATKEERARLTAVEDALDAGTIRHLMALGVSPGMRCLEVGAGGGSIAAWLCSHVGPSGSVLATDLQPQFLHSLQSGNLEVRRHDVLEEGLPADEFDVVHVRWLLHHLREPRRALTLLFAALKPGGIFIAEEVDLVSLAPDSDASPAARDLFLRFKATLEKLLAMRGGNYFYGRQLFADLRCAGLTDLGSEGRCAIGYAGSPINAVWRGTVQALRAPALATNLLTETEVDRIVALTEDPSFTFMGFTTVAAWGHKPIHSG